MKRSKHNYRIYNGKVIKKAFENSRIYIMAIIFAVGIISGAILLSAETAVHERISDIIEAFSTFRADNGVLKNFINSLSVSILFIIINMFLGFSLIGYPFLLIIPFFRGLGIGVICGYIYSVHRLTGLLYSLMIIYPAEIISVLALMYACNSSCEYSKNAFYKSIQGRGQFEKNETQIYLCKQFIYIAVCIVSAFIDTLFSKIFSGLFEI